MGVISQVMFPRLHFLTFNSALGQSLEEGEILLPEISFGGATPLEAGKFASSMLFRRPDKSPITQTVMPVSTGDGGSVIMPSKVLQKLLKNTTAEGADAFFAKNEEFFKSLKDYPRRITEAHSNTNDLVSEIQHYEDREKEPEEE